MDIAEKLLFDEVNENRSPSVQYAIFNRARIIFRYAYGLADIENNKEVKSDISYNAYSVTKTFTALAVLKLAQLGKINVVHPMLEYLPDFPYGGEISVKQVLSHSAGIPNPIPLAWIHLSNENSDFDRDEYFKEIIKKNSKIKSKPNEKFAYSNLGYVFLGQLIEKVSGLKYEDYIQDTIIKPLGIPTGKLGFEISDLSKHARAYHKRYSFSNLILGFFINKRRFMDSGGPKWRAFKSFYVNGASYGGLIGTTDSFIRYIQELLNEDSKLIPVELKQLLFTENHDVKGKATGMSLSWFKGELNGHKFFTHAGGGGGYYCEFRIYPDLGLGSVVFFNRTGMSDQRFLNNIDRFYLDRNIG